METKEDFLLNLGEKCEIDLVGVVDLAKFSNFFAEIAFPMDVPMAFFNGKLSDRFNIANEWPQTKSIISFAMSYNSSINFNCYDKSHLLISKASYGQDYHSVLKEKAKKMMTLFSQRFPCNYKIYVDTGFLSDRALAYCAGIGFYGKNNFIINEKYGSFIFLGHILTDIKLECSSEIAQNKCINCNKCINVCPQNAYTKGYPVDFEKCISYLNQKGKKYSNTNYIYGCDICQSVCSFNLNAPMDLHKEFLPVIEDIFIKPSDLENMDEEDFKVRYGTSALAWRGLKTLKKNMQTIKSAHENGYNEHVE